MLVANAWSWFVTVCKNVGDKCFWQLENWNKLKFNYMHHNNTHLQSPHTFSTSTLDKTRLTNFFGDDVVSRGIDSVLEPVCWHYSNHQNHDDQSKEFNHPSRNPLIPPTTSPNEMTRIRRNELFIRFLINYLVIIILNCCCARSWLCWETDAWPRPRLTFRGKSIIMILRCKRRPSESKILTRCIHI